MNKKIWSLFSLLLVAAMLLSACGAKATPAPEVEAPAAEAPAAEAPAAEEPAAEAPAALKGKVTLWHAWKENEIASLNEVIAAFQAANPEVTFDVLYVPFDDLRGKFETAAATGEGPSVLIGAADWGPALYGAELIADVKDMASTEFLRTINPAALGAVTYKEALIGLPQTLKGVVLFRNKAIVAEPAADFEDLVAKAKAATAGDVVGANLEYGFFFSAAHLNGVGGLLMDDSGAPLFNDAKGVEWAELLKRFAEAGPVENYTDNDVNLFKAGKAGMIIDGTWNAAALAEAIGADNLAIDPWPAPLSGYVQTENIYMSANAEGDDQAASWGFMEYFLTPEAQALLADPTKAGHVPAASGVEVSDPLTSQMIAAFAGGAPFPVIPEMGAYWDPLNNAVKSILSEGTDPAAALSRANNDVTAKVAEIRGQTPEETPVTGKVTLWHAWKENEIVSLNEVIAAFQAKNPEVTFDVLYVPFDDLRGKFETAAATGEGPSVLIGAADWGPALYNAELVADLTAMSSSIFQASINSAAMGAVSYKGALIGLPQTLKGVVLFRNKAIVAEPAADFEDLVAKAKAATAGDVVGANLEYGFFFSAGVLKGLGGTLMSAQGDPLFNDAKGVEWAELLKRYAEAGPMENYTDNDVNLFKAGKAGLVIDGTWNAAALAEAIGADNLAIDPWPAPLSGYVQTENIYMSANAEGDDQAASWAFMKFFLSPEAQALLADPTKAGHIPAANGVEVNDPLTSQMIAAFAGGAPFPVIPEMGAYWDPMNNALKAIVLEGMDTAAALQKAFDDITAKVAEIRGG
ncbi:MAG: extracellular solute-binding protein [Chloroflexi bacterium]|nr:extracellular solute-binding protein [Chloroflexota bacterium]